MKTYFIPDAATPEHKRETNTKNEHILHTTETSVIVQSLSAGATPAFYMKIPACSNHRVSPSAKRETQGAAVSENSTLCPIFHFRHEFGI